MNKTVNISENRVNTLLATYKKSDLPNLTFFSCKVCENNSLFEQSDGKCAY